MFVTITHNEIKEGKKGEYLYIKYIKPGGGEGGKAVFEQLRGKWGLCENGARVELKQDERWNVTDILPVEAGTEPQPLETEVEDVPFEEPKTPPKSPPIKQWKGDPRNKAFALSYAKDLAVADKIKYGQIISTAELFYLYLEGRVTIPEEVILKYMREQVKAEMKV